MTHLLDLNDTKQGYKTLRDKRWWWWWEWCRRPRWWYKNVYNRHNVSNLSGRRKNLRNFCVFNNVTGFSTSTCLQYVKLFAAHFQYNLRNCLQQPMLPHHCQRRNKDFFLTGRWCDQNQVAVSIFSNQIISHPFCSLKNVFPSCFIYNIVQLNTVGKFFIIIFAKKGKQWAYAVSLHTPPRAFI